MLPVSLHFFFFPPRDFSPGADIIVKARFIGNQSKRCWCRASKAFYSFIMIHQNKTKKTKKQLKLVKNTISWRDENMPSRLSPSLLCSSLLPEDNDSLFIDYVLCLILYMCTHTQKHTRTQTADSMLSSAAEICKHIICTLGGIHAYLMTIKR